jgi:hypothetical protein
VARDRTVPAVPGARDPIGLRVPNGPKVVPSVPRQRSVPRLRKAQALPPMPRRASAAVSVAAVAAGVVVAKAVRRKANSCFWSAVAPATLPDSAQPALMAPPTRPAHCADLA